MGCLDEKRAAIIASGHNWRKNEDGSVDWLAMNTDEDFHNGPVCEDCYEMPCEHCSKVPGPCPGKP